MDESNFSNKSKILFTDDPATQLSCIDKYVKIYLTRKCSFEGFIHSIDPVSKSIILFVPENDTHQIILIPGQAIIDAIEIPQPSNIITPKTEKVDIVYMREDSMGRKIKLMAWLKKNLIPVSEIDDKIIIGSVSILPPYSLSDICTDNPVIALQIKQIINDMPNHYEPQE